MALDKKQNEKLASVSLQESEENYTQLMDLTSQLVSTEIHEKCLHPSGETSPDSLSPYSERHA
jgi:hypothetical protein